VRYPPSSFPPLSPLMKKAAQAFFSLFAPSDSNKSEHSAGSFPSPHSKRREALLFLTVSVERKPPPPFLHPGPNKECSPPPFLLSLCMNFPRRRPTFFFSLFAPEEQNSVVVPFLRPRSSSFRGHYGRVFPFPFLDAYTNKHPSPPSRVLLPLLWKFGIPLFPPVSSMVWKLDSPLRTLPPFFPRARVMNDFLLSTTQRCCYE